MSDDAHVSLVTVFDAGDSDALPLVKLALEQAGIDYLVKGGPTDPLLGGIPVTQAPSRVLVRKPDEARALEVLAGLDDPDALVPLAAPDHASASVVPAEAAREIALRDAATGELLGTITDTQLHVLIDLLEEADDDTPQYYIDGPTIEMLVEQGVDPDLVATLQRALGTRDSIDLRWSEAGAD